MIYQVITIVAVVFAGLWAACRLTVVGFGLASAIVAAGIVLWTVGSGSDTEAPAVSFGFWLLFNASFLLGGIALNAFGGRLDQWRSRAISIKDAKSH